MQNQLSYIISITQPLVTAINQHKIYPALNSIERLRRFAEMHVYTTWDFLCLLKALKRKLSRSELFWSPPLDNFACYLINIRLALEESDFKLNGCYLSHFALYVDAMRQCGADTQNIIAFIKYVEHDPHLSLLLAQNYLPKAIRQYLTDTFDMLAKDSHVLAACYAFAREHIAGNMFTQILQHLAPVAAAHSDSMPLFIAYFQRKIDLSIENNRLGSKTLLVSLCGEDEAKWEDATDAAVFSLKSQLQLLDGIYGYMTA